MVKRKNKNDGDGRRALVVGVHIYSHAARKRPRASPPSSVTIKNIVKFELKDTGSIY